MVKMIKNVDFHFESNNTAHRTNEITLKQLIVRRGQSFLLTLEMMKPFNTYDPLSFTVETGSAPSEKRGTRSEFGNPSPMYTSDVKAIWKYDIDSRGNPQSGIVTLSITPPADAPVGKYSLSATTMNETTSLGTLVVLFNPWCSRDWVFLSDEKERQEYVMNEHGIIYRGTADYICPMAWEFGQFEEVMVDICFKILDVNPKHARDPADDVSARCNPIYVSRVVSAMINCNDDRGVLLGNWGNKFDDGKSPTHWTNSVTILQDWYGSNCQPVKYGQCWVFAAVMCTVMRFLGIPCRVVTNFKSAHDTNNNLTIEEYHDENGLMPRRTRDSIWNFHVWVEGWMTRPDLKKGTNYDGWQVLDPTPQEKSEGVHCCGPAPVNAILQGEPNLKYDVPFVFAEVNADIVRWMISSTGSKRKMFSDTKTVGQNVSTKAVGYNIRNDITNSYKHREGSAKEREVCRRALNRLNSGGDQEGGGKEEAPKVEMEFEKETKLLIGQDINLKLRLSSKDHTSKMITLLVNAQAMMYNGKPANNIQHTVQEKMLLPGQAVIVPLHIPYSVYSKFIMGCNSMKVSAVAIDKHDNDIYETEIDIALENPPMSVTVLGEARLYREMIIEVQFKNTLNEPLTNCSLTVYGCGLFGSEVERSIAQLDPNCSMKMKIMTTPYKAGRRTVVADFDCSAFRDIKASCMVDVTR